MVETKTSEAPVGRALAKASRRILPLLIVMYVMAFLDRANVGFAKAAMQADVHIGDAAFALGAGIFFVGYAVFEIPSNLMLARVGAKRWLCRIMVTWGLVAAAMMFVTGEMSFYALRFLLGLMEAGFFPGIILFLTYWYPEARRGRAIGLFYFAIPLALVFGSPLSGALLELDGAHGLAGWKWMFVIEGLLTTLVGVASFFLLDDSPRDARWLADEERAALLATLAEEERNKPVLAHPSAARILADPAVLFYSAVYFFVQASVYGLIFYLPAIVSGLMQQKIGLAVGAVSAIPWLIAMIAAWFVTRWSDRTGARRTPVIALFFLMGVASAVSLHLHGVWSIFALTIAASAYFCATPLFWTLPTGYLPAASAAAGIAMINSIGNLGGFFAPILKTWVEAAFSSHAAGMVVIGLCAVVSALLLSLSRKPSRQLMWRKAP
jgi:MFS family permease